MSSSPQAVLALLASDAPRGSQGAVARRPIIQADLLAWYDDIIGRAVRQPIARADIRFERLEVGVRGRYFNRSETGSRAQILIAPARRALGPAAVWDTLLHEVAHHVVYELCATDSSSHGVVFCNVANEMAKRLGLVGTIRPETRDALYWPACLRR